MPEFNSAPNFLYHKGWIATNVGGIDSVEGVALQSDGKIVVAGMTAGNFAVGRFNLDGGLDATFGTNGVVTTDFGKSDGATSIALQSDGKIVVAGGSSGDFALARYNIDGTLDNGFDGDGRMVLDVGPADVANAVAIMADGAIVATGTNGLHFTTIKLSGNGTPEAGFGSGGSVVTDITRLPPIYSRSSHGIEIEVQADGKLLVAGEGRSSGSIEHLAVVRYNGDGSLDPSFDGDGIQDLTAFDGIGLAGFDLFGDGRILIGKSYSSTKLPADEINVLNSDGSTAYSFSSEKFDSIFDATISSTGGVLANRYSSIERLNADLTRAPFPQISERIDGTVPTDIISDASGKFYIAGKIYGNSALIRYNADGSLDRSFSPLETSLKGAAYGEGGVLNLAPAIDISDRELDQAGNYAGATLTIMRSGGANVQDIFAANMSNLAPLDEGQSLRYGNAVIGTVVKNSGGSLQIIFNANAVPELVDVAVRGIGYYNTSDALPAEIRLDWTFSDGNQGAQGIGGALSVMQTQILTTFGYNDAPVATVDAIGGNAFPNKAYHQYLPEGLFVDPDGAEVLTYRLESIAGANFPAWLHIDAATGELDGTPGVVDQLDYRFSIRATDPSGRSATVTYFLSVASPVVIQGTTGDDVLAGSSDASEIRGLAGNDSLTGFNHDDLLLGEDGDDILNGGLGNDTLDGGTGSDTAYYGAATSPVIIDLGTNRVSLTGGFGNDSLISIENIVGGSANDRLTGDAGINILHGMDGNDYLIGGAGDDQLIGGGGENVLNGGVGADILDGAGGYSYAEYADATAGVQAYLTWEAGNLGDAAGDHYIGVAGLIGTAFADVLSGDDHDNTILGGQGNDWLFGRAGTDYLLGGDGGDVLAGGPGADLLDGGAGEDTAFYRDAESLVYTEGQWGARPLLEEGHSYGILVDAATPSNNFGEAAGDTLISIENIWGSRFDDVIFGADDTAERIGGFEGNDVIAGRGGDDVFYGGVGADYMNGGNGADTFFYLSFYDHLNAFGTPEPNEGGDSITDFATGVDRIMVSRYWFGFGDIDGPAAALTSNHADFITDAPAASVRPTFLWDSGARSLSFDSDGSGSGSAVLLATLSGTTSVLLSDIWTA